VAVGVALSSSASAAKPFKGTVTGLAGYQVVPSPHGTNSDAASALPSAGAVSQPLQL
jgi:hypothetical protein